MFGLMRMKTHFAVLALRQAASDKLRYQRDQARLDCEAFDEDAARYMRERDEATAERDALQAKIDRMTGNLKQYRDKAAVGARIAVTPLKAVGAVR